RLLLMNTGFGATQLADVATREGVTALVHDAEFADLVPARLTGTDGADLVPAGLTSFVADKQLEVPAGLTSFVADEQLEDLITHTDDAELPTPRRAGSLVLLTSGTTGTPKGAPRQVRSPLAAAQFLDRIPLRRGETTFLAAPSFHGTGLSQLILTFALGSTAVLCRRFDARATLAGIAAHRCTALVVVPTMLRRIMDLPEEVRAEYDTSSLRVLFSAGSALGADLGNRASAAFGPVIHNLYGSTEVAVATIATPQDWRAAPGTVGKPPCGCRVRLYDDAGRPVTGTGRQGRIFAGSSLAFNGYSGGGHKEIIDGLLSTGDVGHFDEHGRLFVDGRDDDMIVSGGENVFPGEIEELLAAREDVVEAAVIGVPDDEFGQRLRAYVVLRSGVAPDAELLRAHVRAHLARYKVPREVIFLDELPRNATGKLFRHKLM
ncbi:MAG TPA: AMP-binding protein, partial [Pseudonocardiaceae bacterium]